MLVVGLGNPGRNYIKNRHNIGFIIGEHFADLYSIRISEKSFSSLCGSGKVETANVLLICPQTYMNSSGYAAQHAHNFYKIDPEDLIVIHDELEFQFGRVEKKFGGGHKGHNGLRSIIDRIGTANFYRIRFGVGRPENSNIPVADYLLSNFTLEEMDKIKELLPETSNEILGLLKEN